MVKIFFKTNYVTLKNILQDILSFFFDHVCMHACMCSLLQYGRKKAQENKLVAKNQSYKPENLTA